ncbi:quinon protein alcohol dehydrogenase-like superfamily [Halteromyces radiatus]|uniref:quinon protein alcohol dehydrogenase-like superfamily n=1 Tax=Halteromyces radiatus TaxID=101107 RepID=UPI0022201DBD|nr:quinon protein alcohol dehydrogenase-like superfamily [Halteromyces radiatus]KAI8086699.1 quinon protein alcohol dehydrogenase-like superfamily [Halteromyces radiatus]
MVKAYLRYEALASFGIISSTQSNICYDDKGKLAIAPALEEVLVWDLRKGVQVGKWHEYGNKAAVTCICKSPNGKDYAVGYADGTIRIWNIETSTSTVTLSGHRAAVTALVFDQQGTRLASGSRDTDLIVWDVIAESGLYRLKGHKDQVTCLAFLTKPTTNDVMEDDNVGVAKEGYLISASKDTLLKLWDLSAQFCRETIVGHRSEVWSFAVSPDQRIILSGGSEPSVKAWKIDWRVLGLPLEDLGTMENDLKTDAMDIDEDEKKLEAATLQKAITVYGDLPRHSRERISTIQFHPSGEFVGIQAADKAVQLYRIRDKAYIKKKIQRRRKRAMEKGKSADEISDEIQLEDEIKSQTIVRTPAKVSSFDFAPVKDIAKAGYVQILVSLSNNVIEVYNAPYDIDKKDEESEDYTKLYSLDLQGHRSDIRTLALSSDDSILASASHNLLKLWNTKTRLCIRTIDCGYAICSAFLPGDRHILIGTKTGELELYDIGSAVMIQSVKAHEGAVYSLAIRPDKRGFVTGSADKDVKFWDFDLVENSKAEKSLTFTHMRTLKMSDEVLCVRYSPDQNLLAVSLLDTTVKVFYHDTLKFFLSLYGHKLPVLDMDISSDNTLIATCSADKNVKLWGLDFGDCHKSLFAHQESVMAVKFVWGTHYFFTVSKDKTIKYWDGDKFENIMKLEGHHGEVWALAIAKNGSFIVTGSHDRSLRIWEKTDEQLFLEEEREKELEQLYESTLISQMEKTNVDDNTEVDAAGIQTMETLKAGERIMEAIDIADEERKGWEDYEMAKSKGLPAVPPTRNTILIAMGDVSPDKYVLDVIQKIKANDLEESLLVLPFSKVMSLLAYIEIWAKKNWNIILVSKVLFILTKTHHNQIASNRIMRPMLDSIRVHLRLQLQRQKDVMGYNRAALSYMQRDWKARNTTDFVDETTMTKETNNGEDKKRKFVKLTA